MSMIGKTLGTFECTALLGKGGMGEVCKAKDQKLGRDVAIKVLTEEFAEDTGRVARFQREAKLLASLNHSNIAAIYGLEESDGTHFLVLELIEGDTLADRLKRGAIPVEESLKLALQIAEALEDAHEKGVIHRDLKPANIKVTPDGKVKVLDFGLAKAFAGDSEDMNLSNSPTLSVAATQEGVILGTAAYMSPEQARGNPVDKRADIWAFGVVLFEMLTGRQIFLENTVSDTLASVLKTEPEWQGLPQNLHPRIRFLLERCLKKEAKNRYSGISDARVDIQEVLADPGGLFPQPVNAIEPHNKLRIIFPWAAATLILGFIIAGAAVWKLKLTEPPQVISFDYHLPEGRQFSYSDLNITVLAVSPDGSNFVYSTSKGLYLRSMDKLDAKLIAETEENPQCPFFSPDGKWIGFLSGSDQKLKKIPVSRGTAISLCDAESDGGFSWTADNRILHGTGINILWISADGGEWEPLAEQKGILFGSPQMLPGGEAVLFVDHSSSPGKIMVHSLKSGQSKEVLEGVSAQYLKSGHMVYGAGDNLFAAPFDIDTLEVTGKGIPIVVGISNTRSFYNYAISDSGTLIYVSGDSTSLYQRTFVWVDREGNEEPLDLSPGDYYPYFKISPDGTQVAITISSQPGRKLGKSEIYIYDLVRKTSTKLTFTGIFNGIPIWTPESRRIIFDSLRSEGRESIFWKAADGSGNVEQVASAPDGDIWPASISKDGNTLFFVQDVDGDAGGDNIGMLSMEEDRAAKLLLQEKYGERWPQISPDGRWLAYMSNEYGKYEVFVRSFPDVGGGGRWQISTHGGELPLWSPDGKELFYRGPDEIMAVKVEEGPRFEYEAPRGLFPNKYMGQIEVHPGSGKFLMLKESRGDSTTEDPQKIKIILNWFEELKKKVPVD